jgi:hypothetical protein
MSSLTIFYGSSKTMKAVGKHQVKMLAFAEKYRGWHTFSNDRDTKRAAKALHEKGYIEIIGDQFRFTYPD